LASQLMHSVLKRKLDKHRYRTYNVITMKTNLIAIGNSKGIRLPKVLLEESGIVNEVEVKVVKGGLRIIPLKKAESSGRETAVLSEDALARDWDKPEEDEAWVNL
jgi:antitoxin MazE